MKIQPNFNVYIVPNGKIFRSEDFDYITKRILNSRAVIDGIPVNDSRYYEAAKTIMDVVRIIARIVDLHCITVDISPEKDCVKIVASATNPTLTSEDEVIEVSGSDFVLEFHRFPESEDGEVFDFRMVMHYHSVVDDKALKARSIQLLDTPRHTNTNQILDYCENFEMPTILKSKLRDTIAIEFEKMHIDGGIYG